ncbi:MAG: tetratricopeptide repeat protein [Elusimicrobia bacterium]|nr:tetratricopeptide repeat protein [Elusimicrobiota bacterium]
MEESPDTAAGEHPRLWAPLLAAGATATVFWPAVHNGFVNLESPGGRLGAFWLRTLRLPLLHPSPFAAHLVSLLLHSLAAALFAAVAALLLRAAWRQDAEDPRTWWWGGLAALLFALHPLRVEAVAWTAAQPDLLHGAVFLLSLLCYLKAAAPDGAAAWRAGFWLAAGACAVLSPGLPAALALSLPVLDIYPLRRLPPDPRLWISSACRRVLLEKALLAVLAWIALRAGAPAALPAAPGLLQEATGILRRGLFYLGKTLWPAGLGPFYGPAAAPHPPSDRATYIACLPWAWLAAAGLAAWSRGSRTRLASALAATTLLVGLLFGLTRLQLEFWRNSETLWGRVAALRPDDATARLRLGDIYFDRRSIAEAFAQYKRALELSPKLAAAHYAMGRLYASAGDYGWAARCYGQALRLDPKDLRAYNDLGTALYTHDEAAEAVKLFRQGLAQDVDERLPGVRMERLNLLNNLGNALLGSGDARGALRSYLAALRLAPDDPRSHYNCGLAWLRLNRPDEAALCFRDALRLDPDFRAAKANLAAARRRQARPARSPSATRRTKR